MFMTHIYETEPEIRSAEVSCVLRVERRSVDAGVKIMAHQRGCFLAAMWAAFRRHRQEVRQAREYESPLSAHKCLIVEQVKRCGSGRMSSWFVRRSCGKEKGCQVGMTNAEMRREVQASGYHRVSMSPPLHQNCLSCQYSLLSHQTRLVIYDPES
jgi:hypothetical protein